ncbi:MAG: DegT/DnrJ/EryC1/StrS family aminotransferase [Elusimicrobiota bacterium]|nr:DegT/DnrJ/EryC1/StrS family aminotransferase [Elusimicrobiota bacterium]
MKIELVDLKRQYETIKGELTEAINRVILSANFILGKELELFEQEFAAYCGTKFAIGVDTGTSALELALRAVGVNSGDEVIVPTFTFCATAASVCYLGAKPVFVDVEEDTGNIDVTKLDACLKKHTKVKAIIPVHLFGQAADMSAILSISKQYNLIVIEDAAQAHGANYKLQISNEIPLKDKRVGSIGALGCFSFYPGKNLGAYGDAGMIVTNNSQYAEKLRMLRDCGRKEKYLHEIIGYNKRLDTLQAAILRVKLKKLNQWNEVRRKNAKLYIELLKEIDGVKPLQVKNFAEHVYHMFVIRVEKRDDLRKYLAEKGIATGIHYPLPLHLQPAFGFLGYKRGDFTVAEKLSTEVISLPMFPELTETEIQIVVKEISNFIKNHM